MVKNVSLSGKIRRDLDDKILHTSTKEVVKNLEECPKDATCGERGSVD